jgi:hypothetical protein
MTDEFSITFASQYCPMKDLDDTCTYLKGILCESGVCPFKSSLTTHDYYLAYMGLDMLRKLMKGKDDLLFQGLVKLTAKLREFGWDQLA